ncbi:MAG: hypothetical protein HQK51_02940 [Oligoflexia bacterium]|nr:hypothetical protein [Oligoflexia bacterium]
MQKRALNIKKFSTFLLSLTLVILLFIHFTQYSNNIILKNFFVNDSMGFLAKIFIFISTWVSLFFAHNSNEIYPSNKDLLKIHMLISSILSMLIATTNNLMVAISSAVFIFIINYLIITIGPKCITPSGKSLFLENTVRIQDEKTAESSLKYLMLGQLAVTIMFWFYGIFSGMLGKIHSWNILNIMEKITFMKYADADCIFILFVLSLTILAFLYPLIPFYLWSNDVFEGINYPSIFFLITVPKIAILFFILRLNFLISNMASVFRSHWYFMILFILISSMFISVFMIFNQSSLKKLVLLISNIISMFIMLSLLYAFDKYLNIITLYFSIYLILFTLMTYLFSLLSNFHDNNDHIDNLKLSNKNSVIKFCFFVLFLSLIMIPPFASSNIAYTTLCNLFLNKEYFLALLILLAILCMTVSILKIFEYVLRKDNLVFTTDVKLLSFQQNSMLIVMSLLLLFSGIYGLRAVETFTILFPKLFRG